MISVSVGVCVCVCVCVWMKCENEVDITYPRMAASFRMKSLADFCGVKNGWNVKILEVFYFFVLVCMFIIDKDCSELRGRDDYWSVEVV